MINETSFSSTWCVTYMRLPSGSMTWGPLYILFLFTHGGIILIQFCVSPVSNFLYYSSCNSLEIWLEKPTQILGFYLGRYWKGKPQKDQNGKANPRISSMKSHGRKNEGNKYTGSNSPIKTKTTIWITDSNEYLRQWKEGWQDYWFVGLRKGGFQYSNNQVTNTSNRW